MIEGLEGMIGEESVEKNLIRIGKKLIERIGEEKEEIWIGRKLIEIEIEE